MLISDPLNDKVLLVEHLKDPTIKRVGICFWHGLGDCVQFLVILRKLCELYPDKEFTLCLVKGLTHENILLPSDKFILIEGKDVEDPSSLPFDLFAKIHFPMSEHQLKYTKSEWCCLYEIGIDPVAGHGEVKPCPTRLVCVSFQITCLPDSANPDEATAAVIWDDVLAAGAIPLECHFQHVFHNPVNAKFPFIDATVRRCRPKVSSLIGLLSHSSAFVGVVSGPFHVALSVLPPERILLLEKDFKRECFTKLPIATANLRDYKGEVKSFLERLAP